MSNPHSEIEQNEWIARIAIHKKFYTQHARLRLIEEKFPYPYHILKAEDAKLKNIMSEEHIQQLKSKEWLTNAKKEIQLSQKLGIDFIHTEMEDYPPLLLECKDRPYLLYKKGNINIQNDRLISIIGTRKPSEYGRYITQKMIEELAPYQPIIVSGLAYGIDSLAHEISLKLGLQTIAVLGNNLSHIYPKENTSLANDMVEAKGCLLSEIPLDVKMETYHFPLRNRIVAGISLATIVIESDIKGGSMITASLALNYNREVMTFPHRITENGGNGCHHLIKQQMAHLVESGEDIARILGWQKQNLNTEKIITAQQMEMLTDEEKNIIQFIQNKESVHIDNIKNALQENADKISLSLLQLELEGWVKVLPGGFYRLS